MSEIVSQVEVEKHVHDTFEKIFLQTQ